MRRDAKIICEAFSDFVRSKYCVVGRPPSCTGPIEGHHVIARGWRESKRNDFLQIAMCRRHHTEIEQIGVEKFEAKYGLDVWKEVSWMLVEFVVTHNLVPITLGKVR